MLYQKKTRSRLKSGKSSQITEYSLSQVLDFVHSVVPFLSISDSVPKSPRPIFLFLFTPISEPSYIKISRKPLGIFSSPGKRLYPAPSPLEGISGRRHLCTSPKARSKEPDRPVAIGDGIPSSLGGGTVFFFNGKKPERIDFYLQYILT